MKLPDPIEIFCACPPGLEASLREEATALGFASAQALAGGITLPGDWATVMRANLWLRGASRVLVRIASFRAMHLAQLDKRARKLDWAAFFAPGSLVRVEASCRKSRIYHDRAAAQRVARAVSEISGAEISAEESALRLMVRIEDDLCTISLDTSGAPLHRRGHKQAVGKAPLRENLAALFLRQCGFDGVEPVADPMCGSGTIVIEAAEIAARLAPGRDRQFAFEQLAGLDAGLWQGFRQEAQAITPGDWRGYGSDRDDGAIRMASANAERAGLSDQAQFARKAVSDFTPPEGPPGLVLVNPPYGARIGNRKLLFALYGSLGQVLRSRFSGWRVGIITSDGGLAKATELPFLPQGPGISHGGLKIQLYRTDILP
ncbi:MAG: THUMP domain-containing protein [Mangrovicoccus sp.]|nr:THUMP domain-containing protein [Mangrovicoccus sp.]